MEERKKMRNIIFLDIDGVLVTEEHLRSFDQRDMFNQMFQTMKFTPSCVDNLNNVVCQTNAQVVVSSAWRISRDVIDLTEIFESEGLRIEVIGKTGIGNTRGEEIQAWLDQHNECNFVIVDDSIEDIEPFFSEDRIVKTTWARGLTDEKTEELIRKINKEERNELETIGRNNKKTS